MPRRYRLGERQAQVEATRERIIDAAVALYTARGISATTLRAIGEQADVAPGTLRNHFPTREALDRALIERLRRDVPLPDGSIFEGADGIEARIARLLDAAGRFLEQGAPWYRMWRREHMLTGPWAEAGGEYGARWEALFRTAAGRLADDEEAMDVIRAVVQVEFFESIRAGTRSAEEAAALITELIGPWFVAREAAAASGRANRGRAAARRCPR